MPIVELKQGSVIYDEGEPLRQISFITKGSAEASYNGLPFRFEQGDIIGLCDLKSSVYSRAYTAVSDLTVVTYPCKDFSTLEALLRDNADTAQLLINSLCRQIPEFLKFRDALRQEAYSAYKLIEDLYPKYELLSAQYALSSKKLPGLLEITSPGQDDPVEDWVHNYYTEIKNLNSELQRGFFYGNPGISSGFFHRGIDDILNILQAYKVYQEYLQDISKILLDSGGHDLFALISELHSDSINLRGADAAVGSLMERLVGLLPSMTNIDQDYYQQRLSSYKDVLDAKRADQKITDAQASSGVKQNLSDSLNVILGYSNCPEELCNKFTRSVHDYTKVSDRSSSDDSVYSLRKELTEAFYKIYQDVLINSLNDPAPPTIIKMFLNFGYVDAALAGYENADYLYSIADSLKGDEDMHVYTLTEWMTAIYKGQKEPSRDDFDMDYAAHVREKKQAGKITAEEEARLLSDYEGKLRFELENVFPIVNKVTFGRISTFCPLLSDNNVQRSLETSMVTAASLKECFDEICSIDFSAYFRETSYSDPERGVPRETVHVEVLPEIILMPNVGSRGTMWQEMEGRNRKTQPRVYMPLFLLEDLKMLFMRITGEYRWELTKRIQGPRWSDLSDPSLTSEYFSYLQFYRSNRDLSMEVKSSIKTELVRSRNNYKTVFVSNYTEWLMYESKGSPRLNKFARRIMTEYCPFPANIREKLMMNPQYSDPLKRYDFKQQQRIKQLSNVIQKINKEGHETPRELLDEMEFLKK